MNESDLNKLKTLRDDSLDYRKWLYPDDEWDRLENYWFAQYEIDAEQILPIPMMVSDAHRVIAQLLGGIPRVYLSSQGPEYVAKAQVMTKVFTQLIEDRGLYGELSMALQDAVTLGTGLMLDGYGSQYGVSLETAMEGSDPTTTDVKGTRNIEYHDDLEADMPWSLRVHPADILVPPGTLSIRAGYGFFHRYLRDKDEIAQDEKYIKEHRTKVEPNAQLEYVSSGPAAQDLTSRRNMVVLWDWYDMRNYHRVTFSPDYPHALRDEVDEILIRLNRLPLHEIIFNRNSRYFWGTADFTFLEPIQKELNDIHTQMRRHRRISIAKGFIDRTKFVGDEVWESFDEAIKKLTTDEVMTLIPVDGDPSNVIKEFTPHIPPDLLIQADHIQRKSREWLGMGDNQRGQMSTGRHTRGEADITEAHSQQSLMPRRMILKTTIQDILYNWSQMIFDFWTEPKLIQAYDGQGNKVLVEYTGDELRGDYRYQISFESMQSRGQTQKIAEAMGIFDKLVGLAGQAGSGAPVDITALLQQFLSRLDSDWDIEALLTQVPQQPQQSIPFSQFSRDFNQPRPQAQPQPPGPGAGPGPMAQVVPPQQQQQIQMPRRGA